MIRSLRRRFILIAMLSLVCTLLLLGGAINVIYRHISTSQADTVIDLLYYNGGSFPAPYENPDPISGLGFQVTPETSFETRYVIVSLSDNMEVTYIDLDHIAAIDRRAVADILGNILDSGKSSGYSGQYRYKIYDEDAGSTVIVLDRFLQLQSAGNLLRVTFIVFIACILLVLFLLILLSKRVVKPFQDNLQRQRQFVTDASHELKTPLAIISADLGVLEGDPKDSQNWIQSAQCQVQRMDSLIGRLVELARADETVSDEAASPVDLSGLVSSAVSDFTPLAQASGKALETGIASGIYIWAQAGSVSRLLSILLDNSVKYCCQEGPITVRLCRRGRWAQIQISNPCSGLTKSNLPRLFERFYRVDPSRDRASGGYGIGLSTARAITEQLNGKISVRLEGSIVTFTVLLPLSRKKSATQPDVLS